MADGSAALIRLAVWGLAMAAGANAKASSRIEGFIKAEVFWEDYIGRCLDNSMQTTGVSDVLR